MLIVNDSVYIDIPFQQSTLKNIVVPENRSACHAGKH